MLILPGSNALSAFRTSNLLNRLQEVDANIIGVTARYQHFVDVSVELQKNDIERLEALLVYGDRFNGSQDGESFIVIPRIGTISPWASKATDIARNCGMHQVHRIERGISYFVQMKTGFFGGTKEVKQSSREAILLYCMIV
jgi:phosphoribosylformylglycinamidine synthase